MTSEGGFTCDVCGKEPAVGVACVPCVPLSVAYGRICLEHNAHPYWALRASVACAGGVTETADWFLDMRVFINNAYTSLREALEHDPLTPEEIEI